MNLTVKLTNYGSTRDWTIRIHDANGGWGPVNFPGWAEPNTEAKFTNLADPATSATGYIGILIALDDNQSWLTDYQMTAAMGIKDGCVITYDVGNNSFSVGSGTKTALLVGAAAVLVALVAIVMSKTKRR